MRKKVLILSNPGLKGAENYCEGVNRDVENYKKFFLSSVGGNWYESEIECLKYATKAEVQRRLSDMKWLDFSIIIFVGHGYSQSQTTYVELKPSAWAGDVSNHMDTEEFRESSQKRIVILDCCRKEWYPIYESNTFANKIEKSFSSSRDTRQLYEQCIQQMPVMNIFMYSCDFGETSGEDGRRGGYYSSSLLEVCYREAHNNQFSDERFYLSAAGAHEMAVPLVRKKEIRPKSAN